MTASAPGVALVGHDASRTGAPIIQLSLLRWARDNLDVDPVLLLMTGGPLLAEFEALAPCVVLRRGPDGSGLVESGLRSLGLPVRVPAPVQAIRRRRVRTPEAVVANSLVALPDAASIAGRGPARLVCHVHELDGVADRVLPPDDVVRRRLLGSVDRFVAPGHRVAEMLVERLGVHAGRVRTVADFVDDGRPDATAVRRASERMRRSTDRPVVMSVGSLTRRKGPERFVDLLATLVAHPSRPIGVWLGGDTTGMIADELRRDVARAGLRDDFLHVPSVGDPRSFIAAADVVVSTAVEDPYPLTVLEAGVCGVPVVGFDSGGLADVLAGCGESDHVVPLGDLGSMRDRVLSLLDDPAVRAESGGRLHEHVTSTHLTDVVAPAVWDAVLS